ncbi:MAG: 50S ribosomal protein L31e [archaeon]
MAETKTENLEREYTIPLRWKWMKVPRYKRANKAVKAIKEFLARHMKIYDRDLKKIKIDKYLNEFVWFRGIKNPPAKIKVKATKEGDIVRVGLSEMPDKLKFKKAREEKREEKALEKSKKKKKEEKPEEKPEEIKETEEQKKEAEEKKTASIESMEKLEKAKSKEMKHQTKQSKQPKHQQRVALQK